MGMYKMNQQEKLRQRRAKEEAKLLAKRDKQIKQSENKKDYFKNLEPSEDTLIIDNENVDETEDNWQHMHVKENKLMTNTHSVMVDEIGILYESLPSHVQLIIGKNRDLGYLRYTIEGKPIGPQLPLDVDESTKLSVLEQMRIIKRCEDDDEDDADDTEEATTTDDEGFQGSLFMSTAVGAVAIGIVLLVGYIVITKITDSGALDIINSTVGDAGTSALSIVGFGIIPIAIIGAFLLPLIKLFGNDGNTV